ncbi:XkdX family protein [Staphylococcus devriesei]|nr:XkdX family protein [Staphylococcus devriesei]RIL72719.1 XkdX family protein [Staphylococcus devriesei]
MAKWVIKYYKAGLYTNENMKTFVRCNWITSVQYKELTGTEYTEEPQA